MREDSQDIASLQKRILAFVIDDIVIATLIIIIFYDKLMVISEELAKSSASLEAQKAILDAFVMDSLPIFIALKVLYHGILVWQSGMTLGKYIAKIRVVDEGSYSKVSLWQSLWRASVRIFSEVLFYVGFLFAFVSAKRQTLHDKLSNCVVVNV
jgi:uncharacterized RDD family membrane protein YckC